uniref:Uncharacterized protein n=1 Tax=Ascaris lumbricoides TaxID=6252 RepID=A0A0M3HGD0_ASCLU
MSANEKISSISSGRISSISDPSNPIKNKIDALVSSKLHNDQVSSLYSKMENIPNFCL